MGVSIPGLRDEHFGNTPKLLNCTTASSATKFCCSSKGEGKNLNDNRHTGRLIVVVVVVRSTDYIPLHKTRGVACSS